VLKSQDPQEYVPPHLAHERRARLDHALPPHAFSSFPLICLLSSFMTERKACSLTRFCGILSFATVLLFEEMIYQDGQRLNPGLLHYHLPTMAAFSAALQSILVENTECLPSMRRSPDSCPPRQL